MRASWPLAFTLSLHRAPLAGVGALAVFLQIAGGYWDVAWHNALGRETFWSPPHLRLYSGTGLLAVTVLAAVWESAAAPAWLRWLALGPILQGLAAPFDELWHRLFGLDPTLWSPPHLMLIAGMGLPALALLYRAPRPWWQEGLAPILGGLAVTVAVGVLGELERYNGTRKDPALYLELLALLVPAVLVLIARAGGPGAATLSAGLAMLLRAALSGLLTLGGFRPFPPLPFLLPAALALDLAVAVLPRRWSGPVGALLFLGVFVPTDALDFQVRGLAWPWPAIQSALPLTTLLALLSGLLGGWLAARLPRASVAPEQTAAGSLVGERGR